MTPDKYCQLVEEEGGLALVEEMLNNNRYKCKSVLLIATWVSAVLCSHVTV